MLDFQRQRAHMVEEQLAHRGITDPNVLAAFLRVPREVFVPPANVASAYDDGPLPIDQGQTISQPYIVALTVSALKLHGHERVLEVGTGSGYASAILSQLAQSVFTIERIPSLAESARLRLARLGYANVHVAWGDGVRGWPEHAPYDAIAVAAAAEAPPHALWTQLLVGGRLVMPIGTEHGPQVLTRITRLGATRYREEELADVRFVPLVIVPEHHVVGQN